MIPIIRIYLAVLIVALLPSCSHSQVHRNLAATPDIDTLAGKLFDFSKPFVVMTKREVHLYNWAGKTSVFGVKETGNVNATDPRIRKYFSFLKEKFRAPADPALRTNNQMAGEVFTLPSTLSSLPRSMVSLKGIRKTGSFLNL